MKKGWKPGPQCVTKKLCGGKDLENSTAQIGRGSAKWRKDAVGKAACGDCVRNGLPCFTWTDVEGKGEGDFLLLPLHEADRVKKVEEGFEIRHWLNA